MHNGFNDKQVFVDLLLDAKYELKEYLNVLSYVDVLCVELDNDKVITVDLIEGRPVILFNPVLFKSQPRHTQVINLVFALLCISNGLIGDRVNRLYKIKPRELINAAIEMSIMHQMPKSVVGDVEFNYEDILEDTIDIKALSFEEIVEKLSEIYGNCRPSFVNTYLASELSKSRAIVPISKKFTASNLQTRDSRLRPKQDWRSLVRAFLRQHTVQSWKRSYVRVSRRTLTIPGTKRVRKKYIVFGCDTSSSMPVGAIRDVFVELDALLSLNVSIDLLFGNNRLIRQVRYDRGVELETAGGHTEFSWFLDYIASCRRKPDACVFYTDGNGKADRYAARMQSEYGESWSRFLSSNPKTTFEGVPLLWLIISKYTHRPLPIGLEVYMEI